MVTVKVDVDTDAGTLGVYGVLFSTENIELKLVGYGANVTQTSRARVVCCGSDLIASTDFSVVDDDAFCVLTTDNAKVREIAKEAKTPVQLGVEIVVEDATETPSVATCRGRTVFLLNWEELPKHIETEDSSWQDALDGRTMPTSPTQRQITAALKSIWQKLGGTVQ